MITLEDVTTAVDGIEADNIDYHDDNNDHNDNDADVLRRRLATSPNTPTTAHTPTRKTTHTHGEIVVCIQGLSIDRWLT